MFGEIKLNRVKNYKKTNLKTKKQTSVEKSSKIDAVYRVCFNILAVIK